MNAAEKHETFHWESGMRYQPSRPDLPLVRAGPRGPMRPSPDRRLVILTEGQFRVHNAKTALGVMRYGRDTVVALLDSTIAGRSRRASSSDRIRASTCRRSPRSTRRSPPARLRCSSGSPRPAASSRPTGERRSSRRSSAGLDVLSGLHTFIGDDPEFVAAGPRARASGSSTTGVRRTGWRPPSAGSTARAST